VNISESEIHSNGGGYDLFLDGRFSTPAETVITAQRNWWGGSLRNFIEQRIRDRVESTTNPAVDWCRYLNGPGGTPLAMNCVDLSICNETAIWAARQGAWKSTQVWKSAW
jgi:hypothetical protein